ncbi:MAG: hypothetical protein ACFE89_09370 [Candidatus Hodarchaeota archaeon]
MKRADYIAIALFTTAMGISALLWWMYINPVSVLILHFSAILGIRYFAHRTCWWKKKNERGTEHRDYVGTSTNTPF